MSHYTLFLGAGASAAEGAPVQRDLFTCYFSDRERSPGDYQWAQEVTEFFKRVFDTDVANLPAEHNLPTFEEVLGLIDLAINRHEGLYGFPIDSADEPNLNLRVVRRSLVLVMADAIRRRVPAAAAIHNHMIEGLRAGGRLENTSFITTNYDTLLDNAILDVAVPMEERSIGTVLDYGFGDLLPRSPLPLRETHSFPLYKIHGSLNWLHCLVCSDLVITYGDDIITRLERDPDTVRCQRCDGMREPIIVPPTYYKDLSNVYLSVVWNRAARALRDCVHLVVCGYSLPDADMHIKYLIKTAQMNRPATNERLRITLVNAYDGRSPEQAEAELQRYRRNFGQEVVRDSGMTFAKFAEDPGTVLKLE